MLSGMFGGKKPEEPNSAPLNIGGMTPLREEPENGRDTGNVDGIDIEEEGVDIYPKGSFAPVVERDGGVPLPSRPGDVAEVSPLVDLLMEVADPDVEVSCVEELVDSPEG